MISAIVPARDEEENISAAVRSLAAQPEIGEIIVVDDQSSDRTKEILTGLENAEGKLKILNTDGPPDGWVGKTYAAWIGARKAVCPWLLFSDADTILYPGAARRALDDAAHHEAVLVSYSPEQIMETIPERALIPFVYCRLAKKFDFARVNDPALPDAAANGQFLLIRRDAYEAVGGHTAVSSEVLEDVALARRIKQANFRLYFASGEGLVRTRMYRDFAAMWEGWTKNLYALLGGTRPDALREIFQVFPWYLLIFLVAGIFSRGQARASLLALAFVALIFYLLNYSGQLRRNHYPQRLISYYAVGVSLYTAAICSSAWKHRRGSVSWKGREYPVGTSK